MAWPKGVLAIQRSQARIRRYAGPSSPREAEVRELGHSSRLRRQGGAAAGTRVGTVGVGIGVCGRPRVDLSAVRSTTAQGTTVLGTTVQATIAQAPAALGTIGRGTIGRGTTVPVGAVASATAAAAETGSVRTYRASSAIWRQQPSTTHQLVRRPTLSSSARADARLGRPLRGSVPLSGVFVFRFAGKARDWRRA
jgi:hypothetical protein